MKKVLFTLLIVFSVIGFTSAQSDMYLGAGVVISLPMGDFADAANLGFGGTAAFEMGFTPNLVGVGNIGYITWGTDSDLASFSAVPVMVGVKYFFTPGTGFYGLGQVGLSFFSTEVEIPSYTLFGVTYGGGSVSESSSEFSLAVGAGYELPVGTNMILDLTGAFNLISNANHITVRAGLKFGI